MFKNERERAPSISKPQVGDTTDIGMFSTDNGIVILFSQLNKCLIPFSCGVYWQIARQQHAE